MRQRFYFDTSVFGGAFDDEFEKASLILFEKVKLGAIICVCSELSETELQLAPVKVRSFFEGLPSAKIEMLVVSEEALNLAQQYILENVVGKTSFADCLHIALATIAKVDMLVSWNFKHIVNVYRIRGYNSVNLKMGYGIIEIRSPKDIVGDESED